MLIHILLCAAAIAVATGVLIATPTLSPWWLPLLLIGFYAVALALAIGVTVLYAAATRNARPSRTRQRFYRIISHWAAWACLICGIRVRAQGMERLPTDRACLLVGNHLSNLDPLVTLAVMRGFDTVFVSKPENFKIPVVGAALRYLRFLPIDRENPRNAVTTIKTAAQHIVEQKLNVFIYPEGTRNKRGVGLLPFHNGSFKIATTAKCPVAVATVRYEKGRFPYRRCALIHFAEVLDPDYISDNRTDAISARVCQIIKTDLHI